ncbi:4a-hydroxytetrahydrobiopterin dehydratase [Sanguibacter antarcticus]|uniref:Putative pterin-4-alpha-carbinolamine dehydratase n=1 Tax=Sanguibacter antarcticus TaxID=372484 RepID=A0A2A9E394_9MICO|nr:4a-hydroxytetrahydrobiopterin dehydratase [Sanguibacter antarcticus]
MLTGAEIVAALRGTPWNLFLGRLHASFAVENLAAGVRLADRVSEAADSAGHHPDIDLRYTSVHLVLVSHDVQAVTVRDVRLALTIAEIASAEGLAPSATSPQITEIAVDALDIPTIRPFWKTVLAYVDGIDLDSEVGDLCDPRGIGPSVWFQQMSEPRVQRNRIHLDVTIAHREAPARLAAALDAGGVLVSDAAAPRFWVVADAEGNEVCICTPEGRH